MILSYLLQLLLQVLLCGHPLDCHSYEFRDRTLDDHHVVEIEFDLAIDLGVGEQSILNNTYEAIKVGELLFKLGLTIAHYSMTRDFY